MGLKSTYVSDAAITRLERIESRFLPPVAFLSLLGLITASGLFVYGRYQHSTVLKAQAFLVLEYSTIGTLGSALLFEAGAQIARYCILHKRTTNTFNFNEIQKRMGET